MPVTATVICQTTLIHIGGDETFQCGPNYADNRNETWNALGFT